ncbi:hypothetical protein D9M70_559760 [compost metagenome]
MKRTLLIAVMLALAGCDHFPGPSIVSRLDTEAEVHVRYGAGDSTETLFTMKPCYAYLVGSPKAPVRHITISREGNFLVDLGEEDLQAMLVEQKAEDLMDIRIYATEASPNSPGSVRQRADDAVPLVRLARALPVVDQLQALGLIATPGWCDRR